MRVILKFIRHHRIIIWLCSAFLLISELIIAILWNRDLDGKRYEPALSVISPLLTIFGSASILDIISNEHLQNFLSALLSLTPRAKKGNIGFAVAISSEKEDQQQRLPSDFTKTLKKLLDESQCKYPFELVEIPQGIAAKIQTQEDAIKILRKSNCKFMIFGTARLRNYKGIETHILSLGSAVIHSEISKEVQEVFSQEMTELLPTGKLLTPSDGDFFVFEDTAYWVNYVARYIIGIAAFLSNDLLFAKSLFEEIYSQISLLKGARPEIKALKERLPLNLTAVYLTEVFVYYDEWKRIRDISLFKNIRILLDKTNAYNLDPYRVSMYYAIYYFVVDKDLKAAMKEIDKCKELDKSLKNADPAWRFSKAFLLAYKGKLDDAVRYYNAAFRLDAVHDLHFDIEAFVTWVLQEEPDKFQLHFCLGLINLRTKGDLQRAKADFQAFLRLDSDCLFPKQRLLAEKYIQECQENLHAR